MRRPLFLWPCLLAALSLFVMVSAQSTSSNATGSSLSSTSYSTFLSQTTATATITTSTRSGTSIIPLTTIVPVVLNVTVTVTPTASAPTNTTSASATPTPDPYRLETKVDPAFGVLGALLIITGIPSAFWGHKNRWTSFFLIGFYTLSLVCLVLILRYGVLAAVNPPNKTLRGLFVLACGVAGVAGGGISIFFWKATRYFIGAWGGLAFGFFIQCMHNGGLIHPIGYRWIMYIGCAVVGFLLCTIPKIHYHTILISTAFVGATAFMLGVDCYTTAGLKEFYLWNVGFMSLFPKYTDNGIQFPVSQTMQIEIGLMGAVALMGIAVQLRILKVLQRKLKEIEEEQHRLDQEAENRAAERFASLDQEKRDWENVHPSLSKHVRNDSQFSDSPLMKDGKESETGIGSGDERSVPTLVGTPRPRLESGVSSLVMNSDPRQSIGALPAMDLGEDLERDVPQNYLAGTDARPSKHVSILDTAQELEDLKKKQELLQEIQQIRRSIEVLKSDPSSSSESRRPSLASGGTLSFGLDPIPVAGPSHLRPPRTTDPRARVKSMDLSNLRLADGPSVDPRPNSAPLQEDWDAYVADRKLLQPPSGVTAPIATTPIGPTPRLAVAPAVSEALVARQRRESILTSGRLTASAGGMVSPPIQQSSSLPSRHIREEDLPIALRSPQPKNTQNSYAPGAIIPSHHRAASPTSKRPEAARSMTLEELEERHREKLKKLQEPLTKAETEQATLEAAKSRWEHAKELEKRAVLKRQAEQAKEAAKKHASEEATRPTTESQSKRGHSRSLSADVLASMAGHQPASSRRMSTLKVEDWQRHQLQDPEVAPKPRRASTSRRDSGVPFPDPNRPRSSRDWVRPRDPPQ